MKHSSSIAGVAYCRSDYLHLRVLGPEGSAATRISAGHIAETGATATASRECARPPTCRRTNSHCKLPAQGRGAHPSRWHYHDISLPGRCSIRCALRTAAAHGNSTGAGRERCRCRRGRYRTLDDPASRRPRIGQAQGCWHRHQPYNSDQTPCYHLTLKSGGRYMPRVAFLP